MGIHINGSGVTAYPSPWRGIQATSTGRLWVASMVGSSTVEFWYSDDTGTTWAKNASGSITTVTGTMVSFYIDADDHAHVIYEASGPQLEYRRNKSISTTSAWSAATVVDNTASVTTTVLRPCCAPRRHRMGGARFLPTQQVVGRRPLDLGADHDLVR